MATTSISLGEHWEIFIRNQVSSGRYGSASEVIRDALRTLEEKKSKLEILRAHLSEGQAQAEKGNFDPVNQSREEMLKEFKTERNEAKFDISPKAKNDLRNI